MEGFTMKHHLRYLLFIISMVLTGWHAALFANSDIDAFKNSWAGQTLKLQREIDINSPFNETTFIGTHNSYNSKSYQTLSRYILTNQILSVFDQLEMGARSIEFDAHWAYNSSFKKEILLCHGLSNHFGCSLFDRKLREGLQELREWLKLNPGEVILLYVENYTDGHEQRLAEELDQYLGDFIFKPSNIRGRNNPSCMALPGSLSKATILHAGKQLLVVTKHCHSNTELHNLVFAGIGNMPNDPFNFIDACIEKFTVYPDCGQSSIFANDIYHSSMWRIYEDQSPLSKIEKHRKLTANDMRELMRCPINWPTLDMLRVNDERLSTAIWSWAPDYPQKNAGNCTLYQNEKGIINTSCLETHTAYACQEEMTHDLKAIPEQGLWSNGEVMCQIFAGKNWHFAVPVNGNQLYRLKQSMAASMLSEVWLNYINKEGQWIANG
jgi:hypothetical protein